MKLTTEDTLNAILMNNSDLIYEIDDLNSECLTQPNSRWLYDKLKEVRNNSSTNRKDILNERLLLDPTAIYKFLDEKDRNNESAQNYIKTVFALNPNPSTFKSIKAGIKNKFAIKLLAKETENTRNAINRNPNDIEILINHYENIGGIILKTEEQKSFVHIGEGIDHVLEEYKQNKGQSAGIPLIGMPKLSKMLNGVRAAKLILLGARTKTGKSIFAVNYAIALAVQGFPVLYIDTELIYKEFVTRIVCRLAYAFDNGIHSGVIYDDIESGKFAIHEDMNERIIKARNLFNSFPIYHVYLMRPSFAKVQNLIKRFSFKINSIIPEEKKIPGKPLFNVIYDWAKASASLRESAQKGRTKEHEIMGDFAESLKELGNEMNCFSTLMLSQTSRADKPNVKQSELQGLQNDLAQFDRMLHYCDTFLWLSEMSDSMQKKIGKENGNQLLRIPFQRSGPKNLMGISLFFRGHYMHYEELDFYSEIIKKVEATGGNK